MEFRLPMKTILINMICTYNILMSVILLFKHALIFPLIYNHIIYYILFFCIYYTLQKYNEEHNVVISLYTYIYISIIVIYKKL